jgi:putative ABC transport system permease protein
VLVGSLVGPGLGVWLGWLVNRLYVTFYRFPVFRYEPGLRVIAIAVGVSGAAAIAGALSSVRRALALPPAEAMRPEPPARFHAGWLELLAAHRALRPAGRMIVRSLARRPLRAAIAVLGMALAGSILIVGRYFADAVQRLADVQFRLVQREDVTVTFQEPQPGRVRYELASLPGVMRSEPTRAVAARLRYAHRSRRVPLLGLEPGSELRRLVGAELRAERLPREGVVLTGRLAEILGVGVGDPLTVEVLEGERPVREIPVAGRVEEWIGLNAYMDRRALSRLMREGETSTGAFLRVDSLAAPALYAELKRMPAVAGSGTRLAGLASFEETIGRSLGIMTSILVSFACIIASAVVYNTARIALSERARELASLRVLGFSRAEVARMLLGEQAILTLLSIPLGLWLGKRVCGWIAGAYQWELFRLPLVVSDRTYAFAVCVVVAAALGSALAVRHRLDRLDLVAALKARE